MTKSFLVLGFSLMFVGVAFANPEPSKVISGEVSFSQTKTEMIVNQGTNKAIIEWKSFDIPAGEKTQFVQPTSNSVALNRIIPGANPSQIFGTLTANGKIILINQAGIYFGPGSHVDVGGMIASTADITNANFLSGNFIFTGAGNGAIVNEGNIKASDYGLIALIGNNIANSGLIQAKLGNIVLASGNAFTLDFYGDQLINFLVTDSADVTGKINNAGSLLADGGKILVTAKTAQGVLDNSINMQGLVQAKSVSEINGTIVLSSDGIVEIGGTLNVSGYLGGTIDVFGSTIHLTPTSRLYAYGTAGGGKIRVGGSAHGVGPEPNALVTKVDAGSLLNADAVQQGNGGQIIVWSDNNTQFHGSISAQGGILGGDGGFAETSGGYLDVEGAQIKLFAPIGNTGTWLLDPSDVIISTSATSSENFSSPNYTPNGSGSTVSNINASQLLSNLNSSNITVLTSNGSGTGNGDIAVNTALTWTSNNTLTLTAARNIYINADITALFGGLTLSAVNGSQSISSGTIGSGTIGGAVGTQTANIKVNNFTLSQGQWFQNAASLPTFLVTNNFQIATGSTYNSTFNAQFTRLITASNAISDVFGLQGAATGPSSTSYVLNNNIDATVTKYWVAGSDNGFTPIGTGVTYSGNFNGVNNIIDNLYIYVSTVRSNTALFGGVTGAISNLGLTNVSIRGTINTAALIGQMGSPGSVTNSYATGLVTSSTSNGVIAGLVAALSGGSINSSYSSVTVQSGRTAGSDTIGGLVASMWANSTINNSYATGTIVGLGSGNIMGGLVGTLNVNNVGGTNTINNSYATGNIIGSGTIGGLIGASSGGTSGVITNSFWDTETTHQASAIGSGSVGTGGSATGGTFSTTLSSLATYSGAGWDITSTPSTTATAPSNIWFIIPGSTRPILMSENTTTINNEHQLQMMSATLGAAYTLGRSIDLYSVLNNKSDVWATNVGTGVGSGFSPIGNSSNAFTGSFNGPNYTINNLYVNSPATLGVGLFGYTSGTISNIALTNVNVIGATSVGGLAGIANGSSSITNAFVTGNVTGVLASASHGVGGLVGELNNATLNRTYSSANVLSTYLSVADNVGGLVGVVTNGSSVSNSYSTGTVTALALGSNVGGLVGNLGFSGNNTINNTYSTGFINGISAVGGLVGLNSGGTNGVISNSFWDTSTTGQTSGVGTGGFGTGATGNLAGTFSGSSGANLSALATYTSPGWSITATPSSSATAPTETWFIFAGGTRPLLMMEYRTSISNAHQLQLVGSTLAASYTLASDINLTSGMTNASDIWGTNSSTSTGAGFVPIGNGTSTSTTFNGNFDGKNYTISNLYQNNTYSGSFYASGLFSVMNTNKANVIQNLGLVNANITSTAQHVGGLIGLVSTPSAFTYGGPTISNVYITGSVSNNSTSSSSTVGGLIGTSNGAYISQSYSSASVAISTNGVAFYAGGLIGFFGDSSLPNADGNGPNNDTIQNSYSLGSVTATGNGTVGARAEIGGLVGRVQPGGAYIIKSYSTGLVTASTTNNYVGGLAGNNLGTIQNSFWDTATSGKSTAVGNGSSSGATGGCFLGVSCSNGGTANLSALTTYTGASWSITATPSSSRTAPTNTWFIFEGGTRPILMSEYKTSISNGHQLQLIGSTLGANYTLSSAIDLSSGMSNASEIWGTNRNTSTGYGFSPIGSSSDFTGNFNGMGNYVNNLYFNSSIAGNLGLFASVGAGVVIENLGIENLSLTGGGGAGIVASSTGAITLKNVYVTGTVVANSGSAAGIVGFLFNNSSIMRAYNGANITSPDLAGGIVAYANSQISITDSYNTGNITGLRTGGIVSYANSTNLNIIRNYNSGTITGTTKGSIIGAVQALSSITLTNTLYDSTTSGVGAAIGSCSGSTCSGTANGYTTSQMMTLSTFTTSNSWSSTAGVDGSISSTPATDGTSPYYTWFMFEGGTRPMLMMEYNTVISNAHKLQLAGSAVAGNYSLASNIDLTAVLSTNSDVWGGTVSGANKGFVPIGNSSAPFTGTLNGNGYAINNLNILQSSSSGDIGLFGRVGSARFISNLGLTNANVSGGTGNTGGLVGYNTSNTLINKVYITGAVSASVNAGSLIGGIAGRLSTGSILNSFNTSTVTGGSSTGGLVGSMDSGGLMYLSYNAGSVIVSGSSVFVVQGGLAGDMNGSAYIAQSFNIGKITGSSSSNLYLGGLVGNLGAGTTITDSYNLGAVNPLTAFGTKGGIAGESSGTINRVYVAGYINVSGGGGSGSVGSISGEINNPSAYDQYSFWDSAAAGISQDSPIFNFGASSSNIVNVTAGCFGSSSCSNGGTVDLTQSATFVNGTYNWNGGTNSGTNIWGFINGQAYPYLKGIYQSTPRAISGIATSIVNNTVTLAANSANLSTLTNGTVSYSTTTTGANGFYYFLEGNGAIANTTSGSPTTILAYLTSGGTANAVTVAPATSGASITGLNLTTGQVTVGDNNTGNSFSNTILKTAISSTGTLTVPGTNILYAVSGSAPSANLTFGSSSTKFSTSTNSTYTIDGSITQTGTGTYTFGGPVIINNSGASISSAAAQLYSSAVTLSSNGLISAGANAVTFSSTINGGYGLTVNATGATLFSGAIGGSSALASLTTDASGGTTFNGNITTTGAQLYNDAINLTANVTLSSTASGGITFGSTINDNVSGTHTFSISNNSGAIALNGSIGATPLNSFTIGTGNATTIGSSNSQIVTTNSQVYNSSLSLSSALSLQTTSSSGDITINSQFSWANTSLLTLNSGRNIVLASNGLNPIINATGGGSLTLQASNAISLNGGITLSGGTTSNANLIINNATSSVVTTPAAAASGTSIGGAINVTNFNLLRGTWTQINSGSTLASFSASNNFQIISGGASDASANAQFRRALSGTGASSASPYLLTDIYGVQGMAYTTSSAHSSFYSLNNDINASNTSTWNSGSGFVPIGATLAEPFTGGFDGQAHVIDSVMINRPSAASAGFFNYISMGSNYIKNLGLTNITVNGGDTGNNSVGGLAAIMYSGNLQYNYVSGTITQTPTATCSTGCSAGILVGSAQGGTIQYSFTTGSVSGLASIGGLVGFNQANITDTYSTARVSATANNAAGLVGFHNSGTITNSYSTGYVTGGTKGGLVAVKFGTVTNSFWDMQSSGVSTATAGITGVTTANLQGALFTAFNSDSNWTVMANAYPYLNGIYTSTPRVISGNVTGAAAGSTVQFAQNGANLTSGALKQTTATVGGFLGTGNDGYYYFLEGNGVIPDSNSIVTYLTSGGTGSAVTQAAAAGGVNTGLNISTGTVTVGDNNTNSLSNSYLLLSTTAGSIGSSNLLYSGSGGNLVLNNNTNLNVINVNSSYTIDGTLTASGTGTLSFAGPVTINNSNGAITSAGNQTYSGNVTLSSNATFTDTNSVGGITFSSVSGGGNTLTINSAGTSNITGIFSGSNSNLILNANNATGSLILTGSNNYTGTTTITAGTLQIGNGATGTLGAGAVTNNGALTFSLTTDQTVSNAISGTGALNQNGSGSITLTGSNNYSGLTTIGSSKTLQIGNNGTTGSLGTNTVNNNGFLIFNLSNGTINSNGSISGSTTVTNTINGSGTLTQSGSGVLQLSGTNGFSGGSTISSGSLVMNNSSALGSGNISVSDGATLMLAPNATINNTITLAGTMLPYRNAAGVTLAGILTISGNNAVLGSLTEDINTTNFNIGNTSRTSGGLSGSGTLTSNLVIPAGTFHIYGINGAGNFTGVLNLNGTGVELDSVNSLGTSAATVKFTANSASLNVVANQAANLIADYSGTMQLVSGATWAGNVTLNGSTTLTIVNANSGSGIVSGQITGTGGITFNNNGGSTIFTFSNSNNTYSGTTNLAGFTLRQGSANSFSPNSLINVNGGTLSLNGFDDTTGIGGLTGGGTVSLGSNTLKTNDSSSNLFSGTITGTNGNLIKAGSGTLTLSGSNSYTGLTTISSGTLAYGASNVISTGGITIDGSTSILSLGANRTDTVGTVTLLNGGSITGSGTSALTSTGSFEMQSGSVSAILAGSGIALNKTTSGTVVLSGANTYTGATSISGGTLQLTTGGSLAATTAVSLSNTASTVFDLNGISLTIASLSGGGVNGGNVSLGSATLTTGDAANTTYDGVISGTGGLTKQGSGIFTLSRSASYTGETNISGGTLKSGANNIVSLSSNLSISSGAVFNLNDYDNAVGSLTGSGSITLGAATLTVGNNNTDTTYSGVISGAGNAVTGALTKVGTGNLTLGNDSTYTGDTNINAGVLTLGSANSIPATSTINLASSGALGLGYSKTISGLTGSGNINIANGITLTINNSTNNIYSGNLTGEGNLTKQGVGTLTFSGSNSYSGNTSIEAGKLEFTGNNSSLGNISVASGSSLQISGVTLSTPQLSLSGNGVVGGSAALLGSGTAVLSGAIILASDSVLGTNLAADSLTVNGVVNGAYALSIATGSITLNSAIGTITPLTSLTDSAVTTFINGTSINTSGNQTYNSPIVANNALSLTAAAIYLNGGSVTTAGTQTYNAPVIIGANTNLITQDNINLMNGVSGAYALSLIGNTNLNNNFTLSGTLSAASIAITGGSGSANVLSVQTNTPQVWNISSANTGNITNSGSPISFSNIHNIIGGTSNSNTLTTGIANSIWNISGNNSGIVTGLSGFSKIQNITGGSASNTFIIENNGVLTGTLNGGANTAANTLNYESYSAPVNLTITSDNSGLVENSLAAFNNIGSVLGNGSGTITVAMANQKINITNGGVGYIADPINFNNFVNFNGYNSTRVVFLAQANLVSQGNGFFTATLNGVTLSFVGTTGYSGLIAGATPAQSSAIISVMTTATANATSIAPVTAQQSTTVLSGSAAESSLQSSIQLGNMIDNNVTTISNTQQSEDVEVLDSQKISTNCI